MPTKIRISKEFSFEMAHALHNYDGLCKNIHGHSYKLVVTLIGTPINDLENPKNGMVMDFGALKAIVKSQIIDNFDHALALYEDGNYRDIANLEQLNSKIVMLNYQPTCENMLIDFVHRIQNEIPSYVNLISLQLRETGTSYAEWYAEDNE